jgi:alpha-galactosidase
MGMVSPVLVLLASCGQQAAIETPQMRIDFNQGMESKIVAKTGDTEKPLGQFRASEYLILNGAPVTTFQLNSSRVETIQNGIGKGSRTVLTGSAGNIEKEIGVDIYDEFPSIAVFRVTYVNRGSDVVQVDSWVNNEYSIDATDTQPAFWSFQGSSHEDRRDWIVPLKAGFSERNYLGMNDSDYGGGIPVVAVWRPDVGIAVGHLAMVPKLNSLPVAMPDPRHVELGVRFDLDQNLEPGETLETLPTFVTVFEGDYFSALRTYREVMIRRGIHFADFPETSYEPIWCAWGYERNFTMDQIYGTLPKVKELGLKWAVLDDGWQTAEGDWYLDPKKFPGGDKDMLRLTSTIRKADLRPKLWWVPLAVDPGTDLIEQHPDYVLINPDGKYQDISWWNSYYLCPAYPPVREYTHNLVRKILSDWDYDGLKIDGQHLNGVPPCTNPAHNHERPEESVEALPDFFREIYETARSIKPDAVVEICPCGTTFSFFNMPEMNQPVSSDPLSSWQIRLKGKTYKALMGTNVPYYGDHVELSDGGSDFASTIGIGGVPGTKFTWPIGAMKKTRSDLTPEREKDWALWLGVYEATQLPKGEYLGELYDIGYDRPETHAIRKDGRMYYAFYADSYTGQVELRGLGPGKYQVRDYVSSKDLGTVEGPDARLDVAFEHSLLIEASQ